jgi:hypothetical protein
LLLIGNRYIFNRIINYFYIIEITDENKFISMYKDSCFLDG